MNSSLFSNDSGEYWLGGLQDENSRVGTMNNGAGDKKPGGYWKRVNGKTWSYTNWNFGEINHNYGGGSERSSERTGKTVTGTIKVPLEIQLVASQRRKLPSRLQFLSQLLFYFLE